MAAGGSTAWLQSIFNPCTAGWPKYERAINDRLDRIEDYLEELQWQGDDSDT